MASTKITQIDDKSCTVAWSPHKSHADVIALGTKDSGGIGFEDYGGELDLYDLDLGGDAPKLLKTVKTVNRFGSLAWSTEGVIAGGMSNGSLHIWNFKDLLKGNDKPMTVQGPHKTEIKALHFHPLAPHKLASGASDGTVVIFDLSQNPPKPQILPSSSQVEVTQIAWNTQVEHIVACAQADGLVTVWDLKQMKPWCQLRSPERVSDIQWNPTQGLHLVTASSDDRNPIIKLWDLRASTSMPLATLQGHAQGILSLDWCPHDDTLLVSSGKDNRTILWDLCTLQPIADIPNDPVDNHQSDVQHSNSDLNSSASNIYSAAAAQQKRYHVQWSPLKRGVIATCSLDRKVQAHTVNGLVTKCGRPPKWLRPNSGVSCGFGGTVLAFSTSDKVIKLSTVVEETKLVKASALLEAAATTETTEFCAQMAAASILPGEKEIWAFMQVIFQANARSQLLEHLGFHPEVIQTAATEFTESEKDAAAAGVASMSLKDKAGSMSPAAEKAVQDALVVGNFEAAVECCFRTGNLADALILASCGGADLWAKTQARYFASEGPKKAFLAVVNAVISEQLDTLVEKSTNWQETLAIVSTYAKSEAFPSLCIKLGEKLEAAGDSRNASLCFMCSLSLERAVKYWKSQLDRKGSSNLLALHDFCRKVSIFMRANPNVVLEPEIAAMFDKYATVLSEQGLLVTAAKYVKVSPELKDRLYRSSESPNCLAAMGNRPPDFPFAMVVVNKAPAARPQQQQQGYGHQQQQHQQQSAYGRQPQQSAYGQQQPRAAAYGQQQPQQAAFSQQQQPSSMAQQPTVHKPQPAPIAQQPAATDQLPAGWFALQDPTSGKTYYANQTTGQTSWEKPQGAPAPARAPTPTQAPTATTNGAASTPSKMASKYGDGFVTSASHPELAEQYGNVGTSNPYTGASRPGTAAAVLTAAGKAPVSGTFNPSNMPDIAGDFQPIKDGFLELVTAIQGMQLSVGDRKQLAEGEKGVAILVKKLARGDIDAQIAGKVLIIVNALRAGDYNTAVLNQTALVNSDWRDHRDWLKGIKNLIQLAAKKMSGR